jgi:small ligand-binding sensory domain FIST
VFASGTHLAAPEAVLEAVHEAIAPAELAGCAAGGVIGARREVEDGTAVSVWAAHLDGGSATVFHAMVEEIEEGTGALAGMVDLEGAAGGILLADPATFPTDAVLRFLSHAAPAVPLIGGLASARTAGGTTALFVGDRVSTRAPSASGSTGSRSCRASPRARRRSAPSSRSRPPTAT